MLLIHMSLRKTADSCFVFKSLQILSRPMVLAMSFSMDIIAKLISLSCQIVDRKYVLIRFCFDNFFLQRRLLQALLGKSSK